jgi:YesN/AraC family two-component response regulator
MNRNRRLLIAEDEMMLRELYGEICSCLTDDIIYAKNGEESLAILMSQPIDAVLSDINMPPLNGIEVLKKIRVAQINTPYLILSGYGDINNIKSALQFGATDFLDKPCDEEQLLYTVNRNLDLGVALNESKKLLDSLYNDSKIDPEKIVRFKLAQQSIDMLRFDNNFKKKLGKKKAA